MTSENRSNWSTAKVVTLCLLVSALAFYEGARLDIFRVPKTPPTASAVSTLKTELPKAKVQLDNAPQYFRVTRVIEGDVIKLNNGTEVNLIGVSCPKLDNEDPVQVAFAHEAVAFTTGVIIGKQVRLEYEPAHSFDGQGRELGYVFLEDGTFLNAELIKHGYGSAFSSYQYRFLNQFQSYELEARNEKIGQWEPRRVETAEIKSDNNETTENVTSVPGSENANTVNQATFSSTNSLPSPSRSRVVQPPPPSEDNAGPPQQSSFDAPVESPSSSYSSPPNISSSIGPVYKPVVAENGSVYGEISERTGRPKTVYVRSYMRRDGTYVRSHWRSGPR